MFTWTCIYSICIPCSFLHTTIITTPCTSSFPSLSPHQLTTPLPILSPQSLPLLSPQSLLPSLSSHHAHSLSPHHSHSSPPSSLTTVTTRKKAITKRDQRKSQLRQCRRIQSQSEDPSRSITQVQEWLYSVCVFAQNVYGTCIRVHVHVHVHYTCTDV